MTDVNDIDTANWEELWMEKPDDEVDEVYCGLCGDGYDTWREVQIHMFEAHYDLVKEDAKEWFNQEARN